ncbi:anti-sigma factor [Streptomyces sp. NPDC001941]|uniref:anti-sigma factor n=1 Tax=Streptomyces sp. NPDC001941 TaxID=3154659 RepID=UPI003321D896
MSAAELHTLTGAYALHALDADERAAFETHLAECSACTEEVHELSATAARLGLAMTETPAPAFKDEVLRRIATVRQDPPHVTPEPVTTAVPAPRAGRTRRATRFALAACLAAAAGLGGVAVWQHDAARDAEDRAAQARGEADALTRVLAAPDARTTVARLSGGATGTVVVSRQQNRAAFLATGLAAPPGGRVYQLWFDDGGTMRPAGLLDPARGTEAVLMDGAVDGATGMGVTVEPAGGSAQPTSNPVALMNFAAA